MRAPEQHIHETKGEWHISSLILQFKPDYLSSIENALTGRTQVEIHGRNDEGKMIVVVEAATERDLVGRIDAIRQLAGVVNFSMVYHQIDQDEDDQAVTSDTSLP